MFKNHRNQQHTNPFSSVQLFNLLGTLKYNENSNNNNNNNNNNNHIHNNNDNNNKNNKTNTENNPPTLPFGV